MMLDPDAELQILALEAAQQPMGPAAAAAGAAAAGARAKLDPAGHGASKLCQFPSDLSLVCEHLPSLPVV